MLNFFKKSENKNEKKNDEDQTVMQWPVPEDTDKTWGARGFERETR